MRILKEPDVKTKEYKAVCWNCNAELAVTSKDTQAGQYNEPVVVCPYCHAYIDFDSSLKFIGYIDLK